MPKPREDWQAHIQHKNMLYDFYGELLTQRQSDCFVMHYMEDLSLAEIGAQYGVTPQAIADILKRANTLLNEYESKLGLVDKYASQFTTALRINKALDELSHSENREQVDWIRRLVDTMIL